MVGSRTVRRAHQGWRDRGLAIDGVRDLRDIVLQVVIDQGGCNDSPVGEAECAAHAWADYPGYGDAAALGRCQVLDLPGVGDAACGRDHCPAIGIADIGERDWHHVGDDHVAGDLLRVVGKGQGVGDDLAGGGRCGCYRLVDAQPRHGRGDNCHVVIGIRLAG